MKHEQQQPKHEALKIKNTEYFKAVDSQRLRGGDLALPVKVEVVFTVNLRIAPSTWLDQCHCYDLLVY